MKILLNLEAQKSSDPGKLGYHLENRIVFYLARMISAQKQTEFFHSDFDNLKKVRSIWICMDSSETEDSIEEIYFDSKIIFGHKKKPYHTDLMKGIIINIRNGSGGQTGKTIKKSQNVLIAMLEELVSAKDATEKKHILADEYGMILTAELEGRIQIMCNWSEGIAESIAESITESVTESVTKSVTESVTKSVTESVTKSVTTRERIAAIKRMIKVNITKDQILSMGYTEDEYANAMETAYANI